MTTPHALATRLPDGGTLRVRFVRVGDRFGHELELVGELGARSLMTSLEDGEDPAWPASPPLQQISMESDAQGQPVAMLLGMAGKSHWSLSVEAQGAGLVFDVACRAAGMAEKLGSQYRAADPFPRPTASTAAAESSLPPSEGLPLGDGTVQLQPLALPGFPLARIDVDHSGRRLRVVPAMAPNQPTVRWLYRIGARP